MAEAQRALTTGNDSIYLNPAGIALGHEYSVELGYLDDARGSDRRLNASIIDSQAGPIAGGFAYTYMNRRPDDVGAGDDRFTGHRIDISLATKITDGAAIGVTGRYMTFGRKNGDLDIPEGDFKQFNIDAGLQWRITGNLAVGVAGYNLTNSKRIEAPVSWGAGLGYALGALTLEGDVRYNAQRGNPTFSGAAGYVISEMIPIRAGLSWDRATKDVALSVGAGILVDNISFDVGYRQKVNGEDVNEDDDARILGLALRGTFAL